jgi:hypothetical protein
MGKYDPLRRYLERHRHEDLTLSFEELEQLVGQLPPSAHQHRAWWANTRSHPNAVAWLDAGWSLADVDLGTRRVRFRRMDSPRPAKRPRIDDSTARRGSSASNSVGPVERSLRELDLAHTLIVVACSGTKRTGSSPTTGTSVLDVLRRDLSDELSYRRRRNAEQAAIDESTLLPAIDRYDGALYTAGRSAIKSLVHRGAGVLVISGGYGLVLADEPVGMYEQVFRPAMWPGRLIQRCLAGFAEATGVRQVIGVLSATTGYARVFRGIAWPRPVDQVLLACPEATTGAMVKAPRAQGEWIAALAELGRIPESWSSSDGLQMKVRRL